MSRSSWKMPYIDLLLETKHVDTSKNHITLLNRSATITPQFIGKTVSVHNGLKYISLKITEQHVGFKFGIFILTKRIARLPLKLVKKPR
jgi:small subunit ribosomal protein S19